MNAILLFRVAKLKRLQIFMLLVLSPMHHFLSSIDTKSSIAVPSKGPRPLCKGKLMFDPNNVWPILEKCSSAMKQHHVLYFYNIWSTWTKLWPRGITGKVFWGGKVIFPDFFPSWNAVFPVENFHFGRPKISFSHFEKWKKKSSSPYFGTFPPSIFNFHLPFDNFPSQFPPPFPFFLASFSR